MNEKIATEESRLKRILREARGIIWFLVSVIIVATISAFLRSGRSTDLPNLAPLLAGEERIQYLNKELPIDEINKDLPKMIDEITRLDKVFFDEKNFIYSYTIIENINKEQFDSGKSTLKAEMKTYLCGTETLLSTLKSIEISALKLEYSDSKGLNLGEVYIYLSECETPN